MSFAVDDIRRLAPVARVVVADTRGSVPREVGASMLVTAHANEGTIGGGALEFEAIARARAVLESRNDRLDKLPLGPSLGQCCGGSVTLVTEVWTAERLSQHTGNIVARPLPGEAAEVPLSVSRTIGLARSSGVLPLPGVLDGWMVEPVSHASREIWIWGAGHVGRAVVQVLAPLPGLRLRWADCDADRFPSEIPDGVEQLIAENPADLVTLSGASAEHFVLTYSHALDLELCHRILLGPFTGLGLIGSKTKWARFRSRLAALGHSEAQISRINCPIGDPTMGKHPQMIAISVAADIVSLGTGGKAMIGEQA